MARINFHALFETKGIREGTSIWAFAHVMQGARIGSGCNNGDHFFIESCAVVGSNITVKNQVLFWEGMTIKGEVWLKPVFRKSPS